MNSSAVTMRKTLNTRGAHVPEDELQALIASSRL
jgi:hypothetical protein